jgi:tetratricopeptide (TPR) repeat protein
MLSVRGEAGAGKTYAVTAALRTLNCRSATIHATASPRDVIAALPALPDLPSWAKSTIKEVRSGSSVTQSAVSSLVVTWLEMMSPFVLHIEDLHEASDAQVQFWSRLASSLMHSNGVALVITSRTSPPEPFGVFPLERLDFVATKTLLEREVGTVLPDDALRWMYARTHGNPLFAVEFFRWLARFGHLWSDGRQWHWREPLSDQLPTRIEAVIAQSLEVIPGDDSTRDALLAAALLGAGFDTDTWASATGLDDTTLERLSNDLERLGIFRQGNFAHPLFREVLLERADGVQRGRVARRALEALIRRDPVRATDLLSWTGFEPRSSVEVLETGVRHALNTGDPLTAARLRARAAPLLPRTAQVSALLEAARWARPYQLSEALEYLEHALALEPRNPDVLRLHIEVLAFTGRAHEAWAQLEMIEVASSDHLELRVMLLHRSFRSAELLRLWQEELNRTVPSSSIARAVARALVHERRFDEAEIVIEAGLRLQPLTPFEAAQLRYARAFIPHARGDWIAALNTCNQLIVVLRNDAGSDSRFVELLEGAHQLRAYANSALGDPRAACDDIETCLRWLAQTGNASVYAQRQSELGFYTLQRGDVERAEQLLAEARTLLERVNQPVYLCSLERFAALLYLHRRDATLAIRHANAAWQYADSVEDIRFRAGALHTLTWVEVTLGSVPKALTLLERLEGFQSAPTMNTSCLRALALERLGQRSQAETLLRAALQRPQAWYFELNPDHVALELDRLRGDASSARARLPRLEQTGQGWLVKLTRQYFPDASPESDTPPTFTLEVLGEMRWNGVPLGERNRKSQELLAFLLEARVAGRESVASAELGDALYANVTHAQANTALKQQVYRLRGLIGSDAIRRHADGYALGQFVSDVEHYLRHPDSRVWRGAYLGDHPEFPSSLRDDLYRRLRTQARNLRTSDPREATRLHRILLEMDPYDLETLHALLETLRDSGDTLNAMHQYAQSRSRLEEIGEALPESWVAFLETAVT